MHTEIEGNTAQIERTLDRCERTIRKCAQGVDRDVALFMIISARFATEDILKIERIERWWTRVLLVLVFALGLGLGVQL